MQRTCVYCRESFATGAHGGRQTACSRPTCQAARRSDERSRRAAEQQRRRHPCDAGPAEITSASGPSAPRKRRCLRCENPFSSQGAHQRICPACKCSGPWRGLADYVPLYW